LRVQSWPLKYTGKPLAPGVGAYDFFARHYDPQLGRFYSIDPLPSASSPYEYCGGNPVNRLDPLGLQHNREDYIDQWYGTAGTSGFHITMGPFFDYYAGRMTGGGDADGRRGAEMRDPMERRAMQEARNLEMDELARLQAMAKRRNESMARNRNDMREVGNAPVDNANNYSYAQLPSD